MLTNKIQSFELEEGKSYLIVAETLPSDHIDAFIDVLVKIFPNIAFVVTNNKLQIIQQEVIKP